MIRSSIGIVCALVIITTCVPSTSAQAFGDYAPDILRDRGAQSQISDLIALANRNVSDRIFSSDSYHDDFRFRAAPVKKPRNWQMPIVSVRPAKDVSNTSSGEPEIESSADKDQLSSAKNTAPIVDWVWQSSSDLAVRYCELDDPLGSVSLAFIPRPLPPRAKTIEAKVLKLELVKVKPAEQKSPVNPRVSLADLRQAKNISSLSNSEAGIESPTQSPQYTSDKHTAPIVDWVWQSSSDLAVRYCELDAPLGSESLAFVPRPLPSQVKTVEAKSLKLELVKVNGESVVESPTNEPQYVSGKSTAPIVDWVWESSSDLAVRYCELDAPLDSASLAFIPRPLPPQTKPVEAKPSNVKRLELKLVKVKTAEQKRAMETGRTDYWTYYADCDRWNVVFAIPNPLLPSNRKGDQKVDDAQVVDRKKSRISFGLQELAVNIADSWESAISIYRTISLRFLTSQP